MLKTEGNLKYKDVMCVECGEMKRLREDGEMEVKKKGKLEEKDEEKKED